MAYRTDFGIAIVGAGIGGLGMGMTLKRQLGFDDFVIYERDSDIGGTWSANTYPGCASDVRIHGYCYSNILKPDWEKSRGSQPEILSYLLDVTEKYDLRTHCVFNTSVSKAQWDDLTSVWRITITNGKGEVSFISAKVLVSAMGVLVEPNVPAFPGVNDFKGPTFHSARYRHDVDLHGKQIAVVGNGCTAAQLVPSISEDPTVNVTQYCRTPMWYVPGPHIPYSSFWKRVYATVPFAMRLHRIRSQTIHDLGWFLIGYRLPFMSAKAQKSLTRYIMAMAPKEYASKMTPDYAPGCRRIILDNDYLSSLHRPNITPVFHGVGSIAEDGIIGEDGVHRPCDVIIYATGFVVDKYRTEIRGRSGKSLDDFFEEQGGPTAYLGTTVPDFPNFMLVQGPNTTTGHASVIFSEECQFNYAIQLFKPILRGELESVAPTDGATTRYNDWLQARISSSVWTQCSSWYRAGGTGKIFSNFPGPLVLFWWLTLTPRWSDYDVRGRRKDAWKRKRNMISILRGMCFLVAVAGLPLALQAQAAGIINIAPLGRALTGMRNLFSFMRP
ncbi:FAD/NAD-P-binding domain-containing protein [Peniophora sp. CONT]|nr:FAD/NAD-P-binding domain-containing protein [Peniophora sp. CONT]